MQLSREQAAQFEEDGFLVVHDVFSPADLDAIRAVVDDWIGDCAKELEAGGQLERDFSELGLFERMAAIDGEIPGTAMGLQTAWMRDRVRVMEHPAMRQIRGNEKLLDILEQVIGPEVAGHPNCTIRIRTPTPKDTYADRGRVPFHQDAGYLLDDAKDTTVFGVWMPLCDVSAHKANGCMRFVRGAHKSKKVLQHMQGKAYLLLEPAEFEREFGHLEEVTVDCPAGSFILFNNFTPLGLSHETL